jgi:hypothetical protein
MIDPITHYVGAADLSYRELLNDLDARARRATTPAARMHEAVVLASAAHRHRWDAIGRLYTIFGFDPCQPAWIEPNRKPKTQHDRHYFRHLRETFATWDCVYWIVLRLGLAYDGQPDEWARAVLLAVPYILKEMPAQLAGAAMVTNPDPTVQLAALTEVSGMVAAITKLGDNRRLNDAMRIAASDAQLDSPRKALHQQLPGPTLIAYRDRAEGDELADLRTRATKNLADDSSDPARTQRVRNPDELEAIPGSNDIAERADMAEMARSQIANLIETAELTPAERQVLELEMDDLDQAQIARLLAKAHSTVRGQSASAKRKMREAKKAKRRE